MNRTLVNGVLVGVAGLLLASTSGGAQGHGCTPASAETIAALDALVDPGSTYPDNYLRHLLQLPAAGAGIVDLIGAEYVIDGTASEPGPILVFAYDRFTATYSTADALTASTTDFALPAAPMVDTATAALVRACVEDARTIG